MASDSHTIASLKTIKICQSKFSGSRVSEQLLYPALLHFRIDYREPVCVNKGLEDM